VSTTRSMTYKWNDSELDPLGQDDPATCAKEGYFRFHHTSDIITWVVNGVDAYQMTRGQYDAMRLAMNETEGGKR